MIIYVFTFFLLTVLTFTSNNYQNKHYIINNILFINTLLYLIFLIGLRNNIGGDWWLYEKLFYQIDLNESVFYLISNAWKKTELGFYLINVLIRKLNLSFHYVNFIVSLIFFINLSVYLKQFDNKFFGLLLAFPIIILVIHAGFTRQSIALSFFLLASHFFIKNNSFLYLIAIMFGFLFHFSILIFLPLVLFIRSKSQNLYLFLFLFFLIILILMFGSRFVALFDIYINQSNNLSNFDYPKGARFRVGINVLVSFIFLLLFKKLNLKESEKFFYLFISFLTILSFPLILYFAVFIDRINFYFTILQIFVLNKIVENIFLNNKLKEMTILLISLFYFIILFIWSNFAINAKYWDNYTNYLFIK